MHLEIYYTECPHCKTWFSHTPIISKFDFDKNECWSDGDCVHISLTYPNMLFAQCNECRKTFWFDDCHQINDFEINDNEIVSANSSDDCKKHIQNGNKKVHKDFLDANPNFCDDKKISILRHTTNFTEVPKAEIIKKYLSALDDAGTDIERNIYIRTKIWQQINDFEKVQEKSKFSFFRKKTKKQDDYNELKIKNLKKLSELIQQQDKFESIDIALIEIERELGNFEKAKSLIDNLNAADKHNYELFIKISEQFIAKKSTKVFKLL